MNNEEYDDINETSDSSELDNEYDTSGLFNQSSDTNEDYFSNNNLTESSNSSPQLQRSQHNNMPLRNNSQSNNYGRKGQQPRTSRGPSNQQNHQRPDVGVSPKDSKESAAKGGKGASGVKNAIKNRTKSIFNQKNNSQSSSSSGSSSNESSNSSSEESSSSNDSSNEAEDKLAGGVKAKLKLLKIKIIIIGALVGFAIIFFLAMISLVTGADMFSTAPAINSGAYDTNQFESVYDKNSQEYKDEIAYYEKLKSVKKEYAKDHSDELKTNYIHAFLIYYYYQVDTTDENGEISIKYKEMTGMVDKIVELMKSEDDKQINYDKNGTFYNNLKGSNLFKDYYEELLKEKSADEVLGEIFDLAVELDEIVYVDDTVISSETEVSTPQKTKLTINQYITDSVYASTDKVSNSELVKAYTIVYSTNIVADNKKLSISSSNATADNVLCDVKEGCSYDSSGNLVNGGGSRSDKNTIYYNGKYYYKKPLSSTEQSDLNKSINSTFGYVLVSSDGTYPKLDVSSLGGLGDGEGDYKAIISSAYGDNYKYKNVGENSYILDGSYGDKKVQTSVIFYDQKDYSGSRFCGIKGYTIGGSGCGVTSMAIVASTYENNKKYDPVYMNSEATKKGLCGGGNTGTKQAFFGQEAKAMGYKYVGGGKYDKSFLNLVLKHLAQGHLVVVRIGPGHFTGGGHYMVLGGVDPDTKKVYVYDPNNRSNKSYRKTGNGWYSFNDIIVKEAYNFYVMWKG